MTIWLQSALILCLMASVFAYGQAVGALQSPKNITVNEPSFIARLLPFRTDQPFLDLPTPKSGSHTTDCISLPSQTAPMFSGCIKGAEKGSGPIRVRLIDMYGNTLAHTGTDASGQFSFRRLPAGEYVLLALQGDQVLCVRSVGIPPKLSQLIFDVSPPAIGPVPVYEY